MTWLVQELWPFLLLAALAGAASVVVLGQRRASVLQWVDEGAAAAGALAPPADGAVVGEATGPVPAPVSDPAPPAAVGTPQPTRATPAEAAAGTPAWQDPDSPFPIAPGDPAPWLEEELWSRPVRPSAPSTRGPGDEWSEAADSWRQWADEAVGRRPTAAPAGDLDERDRDLFAADRGDGPVSHPLAGEGTMGDMDPFPARDRDVDLDGLDELDEDEREALEIRRMREQQRRGDDA